MVFNCMFKNEPSPLNHIHSSFGCIPVSWGVYDDSVNQDAVRHVWEGWVSPLQLGNDAKAKG